MLCRALEVTFDFNLLLPLPCFFQLFLNLFLFCFGGGRVAVVLAVCGVDLFH